MAKAPTLLIDVSYLAYRAYYSGMGQLSFNHIKTGVVYGVLREIIYLMDRFSTNKVVFCFDVGKPNRTKVCPEYKANRTECTEEEMEHKLEVRKQVHALRKEYLPMIGFQNIFWQKGFEADDVIAKIIADRPTRPFIVVSNDQDLYQLLGRFVSIYKPSKKELYTEEHFRAEFGCSPITWINVKAIAGCKTDNVTGIHGVGEKTALKFICGELSSGAKFEAIARGSQIWKKNVELVTVPYPGISSFYLAKDCVTPQGWQKLVSHLGMYSLAADLPGIPRRTATRKNSFTRASLGVFKNKGK